MNTPFEQCDHWLELSDRHQRILATLPRPHYYAPVEEIGCSLQHGHAGRHLALGQLGGVPDSGQVVTCWLYWTETHQGLMVDRDMRKTCGAEGRSWRDPDDPDLWSCAIPRGHDGAHDWQIEWFYRDLTTEAEEWITAYEAERCS